jgi:hypothetical protein
MGRARAAELARTIAASLVVLVAVALVVLAVMSRQSGAAPRSAAPRLTPLPADAPTAEGPIRPARLQIPVIGVDATVEAHGTVQYDNAFTGKKVQGYGVPKSMWTTSWWSDGPQPGSGQMAVILGHAQAAGGAVFDHLAHLPPGDAVLLAVAGGAVQHLLVLGDPVTGLDKTTPALAHVLNSHPRDADVALVTCGGRFDRAAGASEDNEVVFATIV